MFWIDGRLWDRGGRLRQVVSRRGYLFIYLPTFLDTGLPRGNVHERDSSPMQGAIRTQSHNP